MQQLALFPDKVMNGIVVNLDDCHFFHSLQWHYSING